MKWIFDKFGIKGCQWFARGVAVLGLGVAGWASWVAGHGDGYVDAINDVNEELKNEK